MEELLDAVTDIEILINGLPNSGKFAFAKWLMKELTSKGFDVFALDSERRLLRIHKEQRSEHGKTTPTV